MPRGCVLTYDAPHRKTADLLLTLAALGERDVDVIALPWHEGWVGREPLIAHRPPVLLDVGPADLAARLGMGFRRSEPGRLADDLAAGGYRAALIGGAGVLPRDAVEACPCVNAHPGYLPYVRGLDALKWAVLEGLPLGVTTHVVDHAVDAGRLIRRELVPVCPSDTFHAVAQRQYELEVRLLAEALDDLDAKPGLEPLEAGYPVRGRMPPQLELLVWRRFDGLLAPAVVRNQSVSESPRVAALPVPA